jgi:hypothetical protein
MILQLTMIGDAAEMVRPFMCCLKRAAPNSRVDVCVWPFAEPILHVVDLSLPVNDSRKLTCVGGSSLATLQVTSTNSFRSSVE